MPTASPMTTSSGIIRIEANDPGHDEVLDGLGRQRLSASICSVTRMRAELGGHGAADPARRPSAPTGPARARASARAPRRCRRGSRALNRAKPCVGLERQHHPGEERRQEDDRDRVDADADHLAEELGHVVGRARTPRRGSGRASGRSGRAPRGSGGAAPDRLEEADDHLGLGRHRTRRGPGAPAGRSRRGSRRESCRRRARGPRR